MKRLSKLILFEGDLNELKVGEFMIEYIPFSRIPKAIYTREGNGQIKKVLSNPTYWNTGVSTIKEVEIPAVSETSYNISFNTPAGYDAIKNGKIKVTLVEPSNN